MKPTLTPFIAPTVFYALASIALAQTSIVEDFDDADWEARWGVQSNSVGNQTIVVADGALVDRNGGGCHNGGPTSLVTFSPVEQGVDLTVVMKSLTLPDSDELGRPTNNGLFVGVTARNDAFYRSMPNFGLVFYGHGRTQSNEGFGMMVGDNNGGGAVDFNLDSGAADLNSVSDGFTARITADEAGWSYEITGLQDIDLNDMTFANSGTWADAGTTFGDIFGEGDDDDWHVTVSAQNCQNSIETSWDRIALSPAVTNPDDTDGDGIPNFFEEANGLDPNSNDAAEDPDSDGSSNLAEFEAKTDPQNADSDGDGLADGAETATGTWVSNTETGTDPLDADSDDDDLLDGIETNTGTFVGAEDTGTDPNNPDSDNDRSTDGFEVTQGSSPTDLRSLPSFAIKNGLLGHWKLDETSGSSASNDAAESLEFPFALGDSDGDLVNFDGGTPWGEGITGGSLEFGGAAAEQWAIVPDYFGEVKPTSVSVSLWIWADSAVESGVMVSNFVQSGPRGQFSLQLSEDGQHLTASTRTINGDISTAVDPGVFPVGEWVHVGYVFEEYPRTEEGATRGGESRLYRNGELVLQQSVTNGATAAAPALISMGALLLEAGEEPASTPGFWDGKLDDFGLWSRALATEEVIGIYEAGLNGNNLTLADSPIPADEVKPGPNITVFPRKRLGELDAAIPTFTDTITIRNTGTDNALTISEVNFTDGDSALFTVDEAPTTIPANGSADITFTFAPAGETGAFAANLEIKSDDVDAEDQTLTVEVQATIVNLLGPVAHYALDDTEGTTMLDVSGFGRHGNYEDATLAQEALATGTSVGFENSVASVPISTLGNHDSFSVGIWFNGDTFEDQQKTLFGRGLPAGSPGYALLATGTELQWFVGAAPEFTGGPITAGTTHHAVITFSTDKATLYLDGSEVGSIESPTEPETEGEDVFFIGSIGKVLPFAGRLDDIQIYDRVITSEDVTALFENPGKVLPVGDAPVIVDPEPEPAGEWKVAHDFTGADEGPLEGFGGWTSADAGIQLGSDDGNKLLSASGSGQNAYASLGGTIPSGSTGTVFFRARSGETPDFVLGVSDVAEPNTWDHYEGYLRFFETNIDIRDGGGFTPVVEDISENTWYNLWLVLDNDTLETTLYYSTGGEAPQLGGKGAFRMTDGNTNHGDIINFLVRSGNTHVKGELDDIYLASGENLAIPQPVIDAIGGEMPGEDVPEITSVSRSATTVSLTLPEGATYDIEYSADLITWEPVASDVTGNYQDTEAARTNATSGYYRGVLK